MNSETATWSIGDLAGATDLAPAMLRVRERRHGRPAPKRLPSGHRRYSDQDVIRLRRVGEGVETRQAFGCPTKSAVALSEVEGAKAEGLRKCVLILWHRRIKGSGLETIEEHGSKAKDCNTRYRVANFGLIRLDQRSRCDYRRATTNTGSDSNESTELA